VKKLQPDVPLHVAFPPEGDHVFDKNYDAQESFMKEPLEFIEKYWPA